MGWRLIVQENRYLGAARNVGASHATGDYLIFMDDDNAAMPNEISTLVAVAQRTGADIVTTFYHAFETERDLPTSLGMQTAANAGLSSCDSDFIIVHDDDDSWEPTFLARTVSHLDERGWNPRSGGVVAWSRVIVEEFGEDGEIIIHDRFMFNPDLNHLSLVDLAVENRFPPISFLFRRAALEVVGPFKEQHGVLGDWEFHLRLLGQFDIDVIQEPLANYHHRTKNTIGTYGNSVNIQTDIFRLSARLLGASMSCAQMTKRSHHRPCNSAN